MARLEFGLVSNARSRVRGCRSGLAFLAAPLSKPTKSSVCIASRFVLRTNPTRVAAARENVDYCGKIQRSLIWFGARRNRRELDAPDGREVTLQRIDNVLSNHTHVIGVEHQLDVGPIRLAQNDGRLVDSRIKVA